ncbi:MAG: AI-2E family transporter [Proteobacteria bacterium]|nr:MAG: AI-2E family transporter [Pseudomonadota bacterium]
MPDSLHRSHDWESFKQLVKIVSLILLGIGLVAILYKPILLGVVSSLIIAYIASPFVDQACIRSPLSRKKTVGLLIIFTVALLSAAAILILPFIYEETIHILRMVPEAITYLETLLKPFAARLASTRLIPEEAVQAGLRRLTALPEFLSDSDSNAMQQLFMRTPVVIELLFNIAMIPAFCYVLLAELDRIKFLIKKCIPAELQPLGITFIARVNLVLRAVVKGQFIVAFILSLLYMFGFTVIGVPSGIAIGALAGACRLVPYLDIFVALILCTVMILTQGSGLAIFIAAISVIVIVQALDGMIVTPRIIGDRAGLHPVAVIASIYAFGSQFGLLGVLLAVPVVAATVVILKLSWPYLSQSYFFRSID